MVLLSSRSVESIDRTNVAVKTVHRRLQMLNDLLKFLRVAVSSGNHLILIQCSSFSCLVDSDYGLARLPRLPMLVEKLLK